MKTINDTRLNQALALLDDARTVLDDLRETLPLGIASNKLFHEHQRINQVIVGLQSVMPVEFIPDVTA